MLVHAGAHIQVDPLDMSNDLDPRFVYHFHRLLKVLTQGKPRFGVVVFFFFLPVDISKL